MPSRRTRALGTILAVSAAIAVLPAAAAAKTTIADLRVEGPDGRALEPGASYVTGGPVKIDKGSDEDGCARVPGQVQINGINPLGMLADAGEVNGALEPLRVAEFSFGLLTCNVGKFGNVGFNGWSYRVNHKAPNASAERKTIGRGDEVLWYFADFDAGINSGDELVVRAPTRAKPGEIEVTVVGFGFDGSKNPVADGTVVRGGDAPVKTKNGKATVTVSDPGTVKLRASHKPDIPSAPVEVCVASDKSDCPANRGERIFGSGAADRIPGTPGPDRVNARGGADRVVLDGGGADRADCGPGRDTVVLGDGDTSKACEVKVRR